MFTTCSCYSERKKEKSTEAHHLFPDSVSSYTKNVIVTVIYTPNKHLENLNIQYYND